MDAVAGVEVPQVPARAAAAGPSTELRVVGWSRMTVVTGPLSYKRIAIAVSLCRRSRGYPVVVCQRT